MLEHVRKVVVLHRFDNYEVQILDHARPPFHGFCMCYWAVYPRKRPHVICVILCLHRYLLFSCEVRKYYS